MIRIYILFLLAFILGSLILLWAIVMLNDSQVKLNKNTSQPAQAQKIFQEESFKVRAAIPYWDQENAVSSFMEHAPLIDYISLFWYYLGEDGGIKKYDYADEDRKIINFAHENNVKVSAVITNLPEKGSWDSERVEGVLGDADKRARHIEEIRMLLKRMNLDGITIDYESVDSSQRDNFSSFVKKLSEVLHKDGKYVEVALHPKRGLRSDTRYDFQDWISLSQSADRTYVMAYEEHYNEGEPGPIASYPWVSQILNYSQNQNMSKTNFLLGIPLDGYDWDTDSDESADGVTFTEVEELISKNGGTIEWSQDFRSPRYHYNDSHEVWFENARSFEEKLKLARDVGLDGVTLWRLGGEDPEIWNVIKKYK